MIRNAIIATPVIIILIIHSLCAAEPGMPQAPASFSWLPHGYGATMRLDDPARVQINNLHGFRLSPAYVGCSSGPVWGWDVTTVTICRPPVYPLDPGVYQLPLGLTYSARGR
jgi:hypothetical protein